MDHCKELVSLNNDNLATKIINYENKIFDVNLLLNYSIYL